MKERSAQDFSQSILRRLNRMPINILKLFHGCSLQFERTVGLMLYAKLNVKGEGNI